MERSDILIVGAGHAGAQAAIALRQHKYAGTITIVGAEPDFPYERPPLSKDYLAGERPFDRILLRPVSSWAEREIAMVLGQSVVAVDAARHSVALSSGETIDYGRLIWAAGGVARTLACSGGDLGNVHSVRTRADVDQLKSELGGVERVVVIGGGYIGLEAAAVLRKLGKTVVVLEAADRLLVRVAGEPISRFFAAEHRAQGVEVRTGVTVECIEESAGAASGVRLADGEIIPADMVIVGIGIIPSVAPLVAAGAVATNGVEVDDQCRTSLADVFAIGDCALHRSRFADGAWVRIESVQNANDQAQIVARGIAGAEPHETVPWFWSSQYDLRLQTVGLSTGFDDFVVRGDPAERSFSVVYLRQDRVAALDCVNAVKDFAQGKALVERRAVVARDRLADSSIPLKSLVP